MQMIPRDFSFDDATINGLHSLFMASVNWDVLIMSALYESSCLVVTTDCLLGAQIFVVTLYNISNKLHTSNPDTHFVVS